MTGPQEKPTTLDRIEAAVAFRADDPEGPQVVTITSGTALALVAVARAARRVLVQEYDPTWSAGENIDAAERGKALREALSRLDMSAEGGAR